MTLDISYPLLAVVVGSAVIPLVLAELTGVSLTKRAAIAIGRMAIQLAAVAVYLETLFRINNLWLNLGWVVLMVVLASGTAVRNADLRLKVMQAPAAAGVAAGTLWVLFGFVVGVIRPTPPADARYLIPIGGMVLGNSLRGIVVALERFFSTLDEHREEHLTFLLLGANRSEAVRGHMAAAIRAAASPTLANMATLGLVFLPGMMTGQILGGTDPQIAVKYQLAIMIAIFNAIVVTVIVTLRSSLVVAFDDYGMVRRDLFRAGRSR